MVLGYAAGMVDKAVLHNEIYTRFMARIFLLPHDVVLSTIFQQHPLVVAHTFPVYWVNILITRAAAQLPV